jgi:hypothetical protein
VIITLTSGTREEAFLSKGAVDRFKSDIRSGCQKNSSSYLKKGWNYIITSNKDDSVAVDLTYELKMFEADSSRQKEKLYSRLNDMKKSRQSQTVMASRLKKKVPADIVEAYMAAKQSVPVRLMDPYDVITTPTKYQNDVRAIVQSTTHLSNPYTKYYNLLDQYLINRPA